MDSTKFSDYEILDIISKGSNSTLHRAYYKKKESIVCLRIFDLEDFFGVELDKALGMLSKEIRAMTVCRHPNLTRYYTSFIEGSRLYIVLDYNEGSINNILQFHLRDNLEDGVYIKDPELLRIVLCECLRGIENCHNNGLMHKNVKGDYILVSRDGEIKLAGFYRASFLMNNMLRSVKYDERMDVSWTAPEILEQNNVYDEKVDIWSFGITILELVYGKTPFEKYDVGAEGEQLGTYFEIITLPSPVLKDDGVHIFHPLLKEVVENCLKKDPKERPTATELLQHKYFSNRNESLPISNSVEELDILEEITVNGKKNEDKVVDDRNYHNMYIQKTLRLRTLPSLPDRNFIISRILEEQRNAHSTTTSVSGDEEPFLEGEQPKIVEFNFDKSHDDEILQALEQMTTPSSAGTVGTKHHKYGFDHKHSPLGDYLGERNDDNNNNNNEAPPFATSKVSEEDETSSSSTTTNSSGTPSPQELEEREKDEYRRNPKKVLLEAIKRLYQKKKLENELLEQRDRIKMYKTQVRDLSRLVKKQKQLIRHLRAENEELSEKSKDDPSSESEGEESESDGDRE